MGLQMLAFLWCWGQPPKRENWPTAYMILKSFIIFWGENSVYNKVYLEPTSLVQIHRKSFGKVLVCSGFMKTNVCGNRGESVLSFVQSFATSWAPLWQISWLMKLPLVVFESPSPHLHLSVCYLWPSEYVPDISDRPLCVDILVLVVPGNTCPSGVISA